MTKLLFSLILMVLVMLGSCTTYQEFDKEKALVFEMSDTVQVAIGLEKWNGPVDCSATAYLNSTETGLLITIRVTDDSIRTGNEFSYMNDGVEIYMDLRPPRTHKKNIYEKGVFQAVVIPLPGKKNSAPVAWYPGNYNSEVTGTRAWTKVSDSSYVVQVLFPYSSLRRNHYWPRSEFSIDIAINDADSLNRETQMIWKGKADDWRSPANFQSISLKDFPVEKRRLHGKEAEHPNILLILTDQQTLSAMSAYGNPYLYTPNMDALAAAGTRFTQSYCSSPACSPSRSSLITGMYPHQTTVNYDGQKPKDNFQNMGDLFQKAGYRTIWGGKWHLPELYPHTTGWDSLPGFELVDFLPVEKITSNASDTDSPLTDAMVKQLQRRPGEPWLMVISIQNPHDIVNFVSKPDAFLQAVNPESMPPLPPNFESSLMEPQFIKDCRDRTGYENPLYMSRMFQQEDWRNYLFQYYRLIEKADLEVGKMINMLEKQSYDENTLIIFTSDHGDGAASHRWTGSFSPYDEVLKVPLIISWFGKEFKTTVDDRHLVSGIDILPTMLDFAGITIPENIEGISLRPVIENPDTSFRESLFCELAADPEHPERLARIVRYRNYKYVAYSYGKMNEQLFDLKKDPGEMENLAYSTGYQEMKNYIRSQLNSWVREKGESKN